MTLPLSVILVVPMTLLAAISGVLLRGMDNNILTQVGLVVLIGLACKNAILIVEFAKQALDKGEDKFHAAADRSLPHACVLRRVHQPWASPQDTGAGCRSVTVTSHTPRKL